MARLRTPLQRYNRLDFEDRQAFFDRLLVGFNPAPSPSLDALRVLTFGSCFAQNLHQALLGKGIASHYAGFSEEVNSPLLNEVLIKEAVSGDRSDRHGMYVELTRHAWSNPNANWNDLVAAIKGSNNIVLTLGLGQLWVRQSDGQVVLLPDFDRLDDYSTAFLYPQPQAQSILEIIHTIRQVNESTNIVLTVSPVPLQLNSSNPSVVQADCVSKSILRVAVQLVMDKKPAGVHYFPSFELFRWFSGHVPESAFGLDGNPRHPADSYVEFLINQFLARIVARTADPSARRSG